MAESSSPAAVPMETSTSTLVPALADGVETLIKSTLTPTSSAATEQSTASTLTSTVATAKSNVSDLSSSLQHFGIVDYLIFILMLIICAIIGFYFGFIEKKKKKREAFERRGSEALDYLVGGRKMKVFPVSLSLVASFVSGISLLGTSTEIYVYGTQYAFILITLVISGVISWYVFLPVFCNLQLTSTYEIIWLPIVVYVPALAFNQVTGVNIHIVTPIVCIVCIFYTCVGGLKAVVWTDVIQTIIMLGAIVLVIIKGTIDVGGLGVVWQRNFDSGRIETPALTWDPTVRVSMLSVFVGASLFYVQCTSGNQVIMQRYLSVPSLKEAKKALILFTIGVTALSAACFYNGLLIFATYHDCDPLTTKLAKAKDQLVPLLVMDILGVIPGMPGLFVAGVFSAALSSLSTGLNSLSAVFLEDYIKPMRKTPLTEYQTAIVMRVTVLITGALCVALVFVVERMGTVLQLSMALGSITYGPLLGLFLIGLLIPWINGKSAITGSVAAFCIMAWICIKAQWAIASGEIVYTEKFTTTEGCAYQYELPAFTPVNKTIILESSKTVGQYIYQMSFMFYVAVGSLLCILFASLASFVFGRNEPSEMNIKLFAPFIRPYIRPAEYLKVQSQEKSVMIGFDKKESIQTYLLNVCSFAVKIILLTQYFELRFGRGVRYFGSVLFIVGMILYLPVAIYVPALTFNLVSGMDVHTITPIVCLVCTFYTCAGGLKAVIWTDVIQSFVMYGSVLTVCIKGTYDVGGLDVLIQRNIDGGRFNAPEWTWDPTVRLSMLSVILGGTLHKIQSSDVNQVSIQRFLSLPTFEKVKQTMIIFTFMLILLMICCCYMGLLAYATYYDCDPLSTKLAQASDQLPVILVMRILNDIPGLPGLFVAGVFSAALSSLSTGLNSLACVISQDIVKPLLKEPLSERHTAILLRFIVIVFGVGCIFLVFIVEKLGMVLQLATMTGAVSMGPLLGVYFIGVCLPWINQKSVLTGSVTSFAVLSWICAKAQIGQMNGDVQHPKLPVSVEGCTYDFDNTTLWSEPEINDSSVDRDIYHLSFLWMTAFGGSICLIISVLASFIFGFNDITDMDPALVTPFMRRFLPEKKYAQYLERRFDRRVRFFGSIMFIILSLLWMPISIYVPALTFNQVTGINVHVITPIVCIVCTIYTSIGGIKGVVWTDVLQSVIIVGALVIVIIEGTISLGGIGIVYERNLDSGRLEAPEWTFDPTVRMGFFAVFVGGALFKLQITCINQSTVQRFLTLPTLADVKKCLFWSLFGLVFLLGLCSYLGLLAFAAYHDCDPITTKLARAKDQVVPLYVMQVASKYPGVTGLFVSGVFSAALSSLSTVLNSLSGVVLKDFIEPYRKTPLTERQTAIILRLVVVIFGLASMTMVHLVEKLGLVMQLSATMGSVTAGPLLGVFTIGMLMPFVNTNSVLTGCSTAALVMCYIATRAQIAIVSGDLYFRPKPVSVAGCPYEFAQMDTLNSTILDAPKPDIERSLHHISFLWYTAVGAIVTIVVSLLSTFYFGRQNVENVNPELLMPALSRYLKRTKYIGVANGDPEKKQNLENEFIYLEDKKIENN